MITQAITPEEYEKLTSHQKTILDLEEQKQINIYQQQKIEEQQNENAQQQKEITKKDKIITQQQNENAKKDKRIKNLEDILSKYNIIF